MPGQQGFAVKWATGNSSALRATQIRLTAGQRLVRCVDWARDPFEEAVPSCVLASRCGQGGVVAAHQPVQPVDALQCTASRTARPHATPQLPLSMALAAGSQGGDPLDSM